MPPKRILVYCDEDLSIAAGGARQVLELGKGLATLGHHVRIVAPRPITQLATEDVPPGIRLCYVPVIRVSGLRPLTYLVISGVVTAVQMIRWRPDALLWFDTPGQIAPLVCTALTRCPYVLFVNGLPAEEVGGVWRWPPLLRLLAAALRSAAHRASAVVTVCEEIVVWMQREWGIPSSRCHVIRNGVDLSQFYPMNAVEARRRLRLDEGGPYVGFIGGFFPWHGLDTLIDAVPPVLAAEPNARFLLVGDGHLHQTLEMRVHELGIQDAVRLPGRAGFHAVPSWISACDICVVLHRPTRFYPGDPMKIWEYLASARPVVATAGPGYGETVEALGAGVSVKPDDPADLAQQLVGLLRDPEARARMGERGRLAVEQSHAWLARAKRLEALLFADEAPSLVAKADATPARVRQPDV